MSTKTSWQEQVDRAVIISRITDEILRRRAGRGDSHGFRCYLGRAQMAALHAEDEVTKELIMFVPKKSTILGVRYFEVKEDDHLMLVSNMQGLYND